MTSHLKIDVYLKIPSVPEPLFRVTLYYWASILWFMQIERYRTRISYNPSSERVEVILEAQP